MNVCFCVDLRGSLSLTLNPSIEASGRVPYIPEEPLKALFNFKTIGATLSIYWRTDCLDNQLTTNSILLITIATAHSTEGANAWSSAKSGCGAPDKISMT